MTDNKIVKKDRSLNQLSMMILLTIITQVFMFLKGSLVAAKFGVSTDLDAFNFANSIGSFAYSFIGSGISTILMPNLEDKEKEGSLNTFITVLYTGAFSILVLMIIFRRSLISILSGSSDSYFITISANIFIVTLISGFLSSFLGLVNGVLQYKGQFNRLKLVALLTSVLLFFSLLLGGEISIYYYAMATLITTIINVSINLFFLIKSDFKYSLNFNIKDKNFKNMIILFIPTVLGEGLYQISLIIDTLISSRLGSGQVSILNYSNTVIGMLNILFLGNITSFIYPRLIKTCKENKSQEDLCKYIILINAMMCMIVGLFFISGKEAVSILYERGHFRPQDTSIVYLCSLIYIISLPTNAIRDLVYKYFYINNDTYSTFRNSIMISVINIVVSLILSKYIGLYGIALGTVVASYLSLILISIKFKNKFDFKFNKSKFIIENLKIIGSTFVTCALLNLLKNYFIINNRFLSVVLYSIVFVVILAIILFVSRSSVTKGLPKQEMNGDKAIS